MAGEVFCQYQSGCGGREGVIFDALSLGSLHSQREDCWIGCVFQRFGCDSAVMKHDILFLWSRG